MVDESQQKFFKHLKQNEDTIGNEDFENLEEQNIASSPGNEDFWNEDFGYDDNTSPWACEENDDNDLKEIEVTN